VTGCKPCWPNCASTAWPRRSTPRSSAASPTVSTSHICRDAGRSSFPFERQPGINKAQINTLADLDFVRRADNLLLIGPPGTGKTGIAIALLREACLNGYRGRFYSAQTLLDELYASLADRSTARLLKRLSRHQPLVIDEIGYLTLKPEQANAFFRLMDERYNRVSTIITTNLDLPEWYELFQKKSLVDALIDRLQHHCITLRIDGPSLRSPEPPASAPTESNHDNSFYPLAPDYPVRRSCLLDARTGARRGRAARRAPRGYLEPLRDAVARRAPQTSRAAKLRSFRLAAGRPAVLIRQLRNERGSERPSVPFGPRATSVGPSRRPLT